MTEHAFAPFVRTLGRGKRARRSLTREEAREAMQAILDGQVEDIQLGAFLMLLRVKEETPEELAGFLDACRPVCYQALETLPDVQLDWPSYAGKKKHHPWYLLAALLLANQGIRTLLHGGPAHTPNRVYSDQLLPQLGLPVAGSPQEAAAHLDQHGLAYLPLETFCAPLSRLLTLRYFLGLRSPINTLARSLNPSSTRPISSCTRAQPTWPAIRTCCCSRAKAANWKSARTPAPRSPASATVNIWKAQPFWTTSCHGKAPLASRMHKRCGRYGVASRAMTMAKMQ